VAGRGSLLTGFCPGLPLFSFQGSTASQISYAISAQAAGLPEDTISGIICLRKYWESIYPKQLFKKFAVCRLAAPSIFLFLGRKKLRIR